ncbi:MAG: hypothetical protein GY782_10415 [Gammaproteobacteria bacterium]|nr:hypothetical protein [Gammaproteobacteria bacterium]
MRSIITATITALVITFSLLASASACYYRGGAVIVVRPVPRPPSTVIVYTGPRYYVVRHRPVVWVGVGY